MFSMLNRIRTCICVRAFVLGGIALLLASASFSVSYARDPDAYEQVAGDGAGVGGFTDPKHESSVSASTSPAPGTANEPIGERDTEIIYNVTMKLIWLFTFRTVVGK